MSTEVIHNGPPLAEILLMEEVSALTRIPMSTLRYYRHSGKKGPRSFMLGPRVCYMRKDVEQWIADSYAAEAEGVR